MSDGRINSISQLKKTLNISEIQSITENQLMEFLDLLPSINPEIAIEFVKSLPESLQATSKITEHLKEITIKTLESSSESNSATLKAYQTILDSMADAAKDDKITLEEKKEIWDGMVDVADKVDKKDTEHKKFNLSTLLVAGNILQSLLLIIIVVVFGGRNRNS